MDVGTNNSVAGLRGSKTKEVPCNAAEEQIPQGWSVISFVISRAKSQRRIDRLPAKEELRPF